MGLNVSLKMSFGAILIIGVIVVVMMVVMYGGRGDESSGGGELVNKPPVVGVGGEAVESAPVGGDLKYFMKEDFSRHTFLVKYVSEQKNVLTKAGSAPKSMKEERFGVVLRMSPAGADEEGQLKLRMKTEQLELELFGVKIESKSLVPPPAVEAVAELSDIHRVLQILAGMSWEVWVDTKTNYRVTNVIGENKTAAFAAESEVFKRYFKSYQEMLEKEVASGVVMAAGDYLPGKEVKVGQKWDIAIIPGGVEDGPFPIQTQCRLDELVREEEKELARVTYAIGYQSSREEERTVDGQSATVKKKLMDGGGEVVFDLSEDFARDFSMNYKNTIDLLFEDESEGVLTMEVEVTIEKQIIK